MTTAPIDQYDPVRTRRAIVDSALDLFGHQGYERTSVHQITTQAGLTKGAFYHHFKSKLDLLVYVEEEYVDAQLELVDRTVLTERDPRLRLELVIRGLLRSASWYGAHMSIYRQEHRRLAGDAFAGVREKRDILESVVVGAVEDGVASGAFDPRFDPHVVALGIVGMCVWTLERYNLPGPIHLDDVADQCCALVFGGLSAAPAPSPGTA